MDVRARFYSRWGRSVGVGVVFFTLAVRKFRKDVVFLRKALRRLLNLVLGAVLSRMVPVYVDDVWSHGFLVAVGSFILNELRGKV